MHCPNTAVQRERHPTPRLDEIIHDLNGAPVFHKLNLNHTYHQIKLHPNSRHLTTFRSHQGLRRYTRLMFIISSAAELFQHLMQELLTGIPWARNISDDTGIFGRDQESFDIILRRMLQSLREKGLILGRNTKCQFNVPEIQLLHGHTFPGWWSCALLLRPTRKQSRFL